MASTILSLQIESKFLRNNHAGDESLRPLSVYLPEGYDLESKAKLPVLFLLAPWTSAGREQFNWKALRRSVPEIFDDLIAQKSIPPVAVVAPDLYSHYGGSQYVDSDFFGAHGRHIIEEVIPFCESRLPVLKGAAHRGVFGRSSGGFGALRLAMDFPGHFAAAACHSGDLGFEIMFAADMILFCDRLAQFGGSSQSFLDYVRRQVKIARGDVHMMMLLGMCGFYSPNLNAEAGFDLPVDLRTGKRIDQVWQRWLKHDPIERITTHGEGLAQLKALYLECGTKDQYHLLYGARQFRDQLVAGGMKHRYEEFDDDHSGTEYRYAESLPEMLAVMT